MIKKTILKSIGVLGVLSMASSAHAQPITKWTLAVYEKGAAAPIFTVDLPAADVTCGIDPAGPIADSLTTVAAVWNDPATTGKLCVWIDPGARLLAATPPGGSYEVTISATNSWGTAPESPRVPFEHPSSVAVATRTKPPGN